MARIKKKGLDYFPVNTYFLYDRSVRRLMKNEGDSAVAILFTALSYIYAGEGYYVHADDVFYDDVAASLYERTAADVKRVLRLAVDYGLFDAGLFEREHILTSVDIQKQYLFVTRRRTTSRLEDAYRLLSDEQMSENKEHAGQTASSGEMKTSPADNDTEGINVTLTPENVTFGTQSIAQQSIAQHSVAKQRTENPLFHSPLEKAGEKAPEEGEKEEILSGKTCGNTAGDAVAASSPGSTANAPDGKRKAWTQTAIDRLQPPSDGVARNYSGLLDNLRSYSVPPSEQYVIILKSNFGAIGGKVWRGLATLRDGGGKIKLPGRYLLSVVSQQDESA